MTHNRICSYLSFLYEKIESCFDAHRLSNGRLEKKPTQAQIPHSRNTFTSIAAPTNPHCYWCVKPQRQSPGRSGVLHVLAPTRCAAEVLEKKARLLELPPTFLAASEAIRQGMSSGWRVSTVIIDSFQ
jgi:hypothetical protein